MLRTVVLRCPDLLEESEDGGELRRFAALLAEVAELCPFVEVLRLGLLAFPLRGPERFLGGEERVLDELARRARVVLGDGGEFTIGVADGAFAAACAARRDLVVPEAGAAAFLASLPVASLGQPRLATTLQRLGLHRLGDLAELPVERLTGRFGREALACWRVARGEADDLPGLRDPGVLRRLDELRAEREVGYRQPDFFGGSSTRDRQALACARRLQDRLGVASLEVAHLRGGRDPGGRGQLLPLGSPEPAQDLEGPWPGCIPPPSPARVPRRVQVVELVGSSGEAIRLGSSATLAVAPRWLRVGGAQREVVAWSAPWPVSERWWQRRQRRARMQLLLADGSAVLLGYAAGSWSLAGVYD